MKIANPCKSLNEIRTIPVQAHLPSAQVAAMLLQQPYVCDKDLLWGTESLSHPWGVHLDFTSKTLKTTKRLTRHDSSTFCLPCPTPLLDCRVHWIMPTFKKAPGPAIGCWGGCLLCRSFIRVRRQKGTRFPPTASLRAKRWRSANHGSCNMMRASQQPVQESHVLTRQTVKIPFKSLVATTPSPPQKASLHCLSQIRRRDMRPFFRSPFLKLVWQTLATRAHNAVLTWE